MFKNYQRKESFGPVAAAVAVAAFGLLSLVIADHSPWSRPHVQGPETSFPTPTHADTAAAAQRAHP
jgi:hypothetical protein